MKSGSASLRSIDVLYFPPSNLQFLQPVKLEELASGNKEVLTHLFSRSSNQLLLSLMRSHREKYHIEYHVERVPTSKPLTLQVFKHWSATYWPIQTRCVDGAIAYEKFGTLQRFSFEERSVIKHWKHRVSKNNSLLVVCSTTNLLVAEVEATAASSCGKGTAIKHPLEHLCLRGIDSVSNKILRNRSLIRCGHARAGGGERATSDSSKRQKILATDAGEIADSWFDSIHTYLLTNMDVYVKTEPCVMCAMALLHSRVRRVFYDLADEPNGGLGSTQRLNCCKALNHNFEVFVGSVT